MSLIADALKAAQRERQRRESGGSHRVSPLIVPLTAKPRAIVSVRRHLIIGVSTFVTVAALAIMVQRMRKPAPLVTLPPVPSPLAGTPLLGEPAAAGDPVKSSTRPPVAPVDSTPRLSIQERVGPPRSSMQEPVDPPRIGISRPAEPVAAGAVPPPPPPRSAPAPAASSAVLQGQPKFDSISAANAPTREVRPAGRLRIAVEQPRQSDAAQLFAEALTAHRAGNLPLARALYERVLTIAPNDADALNNLGVLWSGQREFDRALDLLRRAASVAPRNPGTWNNIGAALHAQGRGSDAAAAFRHALTIDPQHQGAKVGLAQHYLANGSAGQARELLEEVLAANPALAEAHYALGQAFELQGDRPGAIRSFSAFIRLAPPRLAGHVDRVRRHVDSLSAGTP